MASPGTDAPGLFPFNDVLFTHDKLSPVCAPLFPVRILPSSRQKRLSGKPTTLRKSPCTRSTSIPPSAWMP